MVERCLVALLLVGGACAQDGLDNIAADSSALDAEFFRCQVQPILTKTCAFMDCHGNDERPLRVYAEQRFRLGVTYEIPFTRAELDANFAAIAGFVEGAQEGTSLLTEKPLDARFGGGFHRGRNQYGEDDVFLSRDDPDYQTLVKFARGEVETPGCIPTAGGSI